MSSPNVEKSPYGKYVDRLTELMPGLTVALLDQYLLVTSPKLQETLHVKLSDIDTGEQSDIPYAIKVFYERHCNDL